MVTFNLQDNSELEVIRAAHALGKGVLIKKALNSGNEIREATATEQPVAESLRFVLSEPGVSSAIVGTINAHHLAANAACVIAE
jgi:aryl-alcohol dehydrogenase-like predicted oxidoreductase